MFVGRVLKAPWRLNVSRPHPRRAQGTSPGLDTLAGAHYSTTETRFVGRVVKAPWRLNVSRPHPPTAVGTSPGLDTLADARYSTTETASCSTTEMTPCSTTETTPYSTTDNRGLREAEGAGDDGGEDDEGHEAHAGDLP